MDYRMIRHAPAPPTTTETAYQYFEAARIAMLGGDGIGPEVALEARRVLEAIARMFHHTFTFEQYLVGGAAIDATGMCLFIAFPLLDQPETFQALIDVINGFSGASLTADDVTELGKSILKNERDFNAAAGFTNKDDRLPDYFKKEKLPPHDITFQVSDQELDQVHSY